MLDRISNMILCKITTQDTADQEKEVLLFGITRIIEDIPKTIGIIAIALILGIIKEIVIITLVCIAYKTFVGGVHAKTNWGCFIYSTIFYLLITYSTKYIHFGITIEGVENI